LATVSKKLNAQWIYSPQPACVNDPVYFSNQTIVSGASVPSFGVHITGFGTHGTPPGPGQLTFSSVQTANFGYLSDGVHQQWQAWTAANTGAGTQWAMWQYLTPRSVNRIVFWNCASCAATRAPVKGRLYYNDGTGWKIAKVFTFPYPSNGNFDSGYFTETQGIFAKYWKLELDVTSANSPAWGEFQVYASAPAVGGTVSWDFGDGSPLASGQNVSHIYAVPGTYVVRMIVNAAGACPDTLDGTVVVQDCNVLPNVVVQLKGEVIQPAYGLLKWMTTEPIRYARLEKWQNGMWVAIYEETEEGAVSFSYVDTLLEIGYPNIYRVYSVHRNGLSVYSNQVVLEVQAPLTDFVMVYPNPIEKRFMIRVGLVKEGDYAYEVYDLSGRRVLGGGPVRLESGVYEFPYDGETWADGVYIVKVYLRDRLYVSRLLKVRP
jgi:hypothetical protein